jgi:hypothetical protein
LIFSPHLRERGPHIRVEAIDQHLLGGIHHGGDQLGEGSSASGTGTSRRTSWCRPSFLCGTHLVIAEQSADNSKTTVSTVANLFVVIIPIFRPETAKPEVMWPGAE